ncbi:thioesterase family protein [Roseibium sp. TrichSKD4]|uniref:acyl-CoA thioesterase n=1 Tax=Roseibium sp. TrichSKD4 TaxID=744980 RepID=UPI00058BDB2F|nr:thioesterase family protein [Roseibium sp. TrichSKD4]
MSRSLITLYSFVNRWECDENDHLNVQFYFSRFEEADRQFRLSTGLSETLVGARRVRHVRYHKEMRCGDLITVSSYIAFDGPHMLTVIHQMHNATTDELTATAIDGYEPNSSSVKALRTRFKDYNRPIPDEATPRGLAPTPTQFRSSMDGLLQAGASICFKGTVLPRHIGTDQRADDGFALSCFTDGVAHIWEQTPMTHAYLTENGYGRVAAEMKLTWLSPLKVGDAVGVVSGVTSMGDKVFTLRHHLFETRTQRITAICDVVAMMMDLKTRKAVELPSFSDEDTARVAAD